MDGAERISCHVIASLGSPNALPDIELVDLFIRTATV